MISWYTFSKIPWIFCNEFQIFKSTFLKLIRANSFWYLSLNRKLPNLDTLKSKSSWWEIKIFSNNFDLLDYIITISYYNSSQLFRTSQMVCHKMSWEQSYIEHHQGDNWSRKKVMNQDSQTLQSKVHLEDNLYFLTTHTLLLLRHRSIRKILLP